MGITLSELGSLQHGGRNRGGRESYAPSPPLLCKFSIDSAPILFLTVSMVMGVAGNGPSTSKFLPTTMYSIDGVGA